MFRKKWEFKHVALNLSGLYSCYASTKTYDTGEFNNETGVTGLEG